MFKLCGKIVIKNNIVKIRVVEMKTEDLSAEELLLKGVEDLCNHFDISNPIWMGGNKHEMNHIKKTRFKAQHFIEEIDFDYFEIEYLNNNYIKL